MTILTKPVRRNLNRSAGSFGDRGRETVITLYPGGLIGFRAKGTRSEYTVSIDACFDLAVKIDAEQRRKLKGKST